MMIRRLATSGLFWLWITIVLIIIDRFTKSWVVEHLYAFNPVEILPFFNLTLAYNSGAAFSFLNSADGWQNWLFGSFALIVSGFILVWLSRLPRQSRWLSIALCLILAGAISNTWDRVSYGYVIDFLDFHLGGWHFAIFNIADSAICVGAFMLLISWLPLSRR